MTGGHFRNASWSGLATGARAATGLLSTLLAVRLLGVGPYGHVSTWLSLFVVYLSLNSGVFTMLVVRLTAASDDADRGDATEAAAAFCIASLSVLAALTLLVGAYLSNLLVPGVNYDKSLGAAAILMGLLSAIQILVALQAAVVEGAGRLDLATKWQLAGPLVIVCILGFSFISGRHLEAETYVGVLCAGAAVDMSLLWCVRRSLSLRIPVSMRSECLGNVAHLLRTGGVLQAATLLNLFLEPVNKFLLNSFAGAASVAAYDLAMRVIWGILHLCGAAMRVFLHMGSQDDEAVGRMFARAMTLLGGPVLMMHTAGVLFLLWTAHYWVKIDTFSVMIFFGIASVSNLGMIFVTPLYLNLIGRRDLLFVLRTQAILAMVNVSVSAVLIPWLGLIGAAFGLLGATVVNAVSIYRRSRIDRAAYAAEGATAARVRWRGAISAGLLLVAIAWGAAGGEHFLVPILIIGCLAMLVPGEPLIGRVISQFLRRGA